MGKPKFSRKRYVTPSHPWQEDRIKDENELIKKYGLKNKREIWKAETKLRRYRGQARALLAKIGTDAQSQKESKQLLDHLTRMSILPPNSNLDDVLALENESILSRRLQTLTYLKGLANTPNQARQLICHGHITISGRKITIPSYLVTKKEESDIAYTASSVLNDTMHPARPKADFKSVKIKKDKKTDTEPKKEKKVEEKTEEIKEEKTKEPKKEEKQTGEKPKIEKEKTEEVNEEKQVEKKDKSEKTNQEATDDKKPKEETKNPDMPKEEKKDEKEKGDK